MVSTRGIKLKFSENERVLCYEPDPTKAKVLYDSKVLHVVFAKDPRGKKVVEYLIHFQGWNSSWDRYVGEEYILKDTPENRQLQKDLADKSQLQLGAYLYRRDRKKHNRAKGSAPLSDDGSSGSPTRMDTDDANGESSTSDDDSSIEDDQFHIELPLEMRDFLEQDFCLINTKNKLVKLPAEPNIVTILENYWKHFASSLLCDEKVNGKSRWPLANSNSNTNTSNSKKRPEDIQSLSVCSEVLDGLRIYFDFTINDLLLYKSEQKQIATAPASYKKPNNINDASKQDISFMDYITFPNNFSEEEFPIEKSVSRKRTLRSNKSLEGSGTTNGNSASSSGEAVPDIGKPTSWCLLPEHVYNQNPLPPCLVYGAIHLCRLFVKLPELLAMSSFDESKGKALFHHIDLFVDYLNEHREWFGDKYYIDKLI